MALGLFTGGGILAFVASAGAANNVNPGGTWPSATYGRLYVNTAAGAANWTGLEAATVDGQGLLLRNNTGGNNLTLNANNAGSSAANRFNAPGDVVILPGQSIMLVYDLTNGIWDVMT